MSSKIDIEAGVVASLVSCGHCKGTGTCRNDDNGRTSCEECQRRLYKGSRNGIIVSCSKCNGSGQQIITKKI